MLLKEPRTGVFEATMTAHELSAILAGARMSLSLMEQDPTGATDEARAALASVLSDFDAALARGRDAGAG
jgi:predicted DNA-binding transcriptional regulator YafY